ncbi:Hypothetical protein NGAL_HAMBI490_61110 [Neorhizobium galegae bv. officinalis]|nr:Hypothetical protein NGAL_HAMBI490_61110 [Neorhizobium galegae bv. officinalis]
MIVQGKRLTWEVVSGSLVGTLCAVYLTPLIGKWAQFDMADISTNNAMAFAIGIIGLSLAEGLVKLAQRWAANPKLPTTPTLDALAEVTKDEPEDK